MKNSLALACAALLLCSFGPKQDLLHVQSIPLYSGQISGLQSADQVVKIFLGIPFAAPPTGHLRWKAPQPVTPWQGIKACT
ncbi:MAG: carboxylesterase family protein, partial [Marinilabiliales bacterium]|nr:carboxylesterase family protein [Marinilabiliales bacterium]